MLTCRSYEDTVKQFNTNFFGAMNLTRAMLPYFRAQRRGKIVFMSSISGWLGAAAGGPYTATKFALEGIPPSDEIQAVFCR